MVVFPTQLINISTGAPVILQSIPPSKPPAYIVRVDVMWSFSLILSLSCALFATSMQQRARKYLEYAMPRYAWKACPYSGLHVRRCREVWILANGRLLQTHLSVFHLIPGPIDFFFHINKVVAFSILGLTAHLALGYAQYTALPFSGLNSLCRTPWS